MAKRRMNLDNKYAHDWNTPSPQRGNMRRLGVLEEFCKLNCDDWPLGCREQPPQCHRHAERRFVMKCLSTLGTY
eukprot:scaffold12613_cov110-Skeletonema_dohrnii-CCMP3373.AAC.3